MYVCVCVCISLGHTPARSLTDGVASCLADEAARWQTNWLSDGAIKYCKYIYTHIHMYKKCAIKVTDELTKCINANAKTTIWQMLNS